MTTYQLSRTRNEPLTTLLGALSRRLHVFVSPEEIVLRRGQKSVAVRTFISVAPDGKILSVGQLSAGGRRVDLFPEKADDDDKIREVVLEKFFGHAFVTLANRSFMIRPVVVVSGDATIERMLRGYQRPALVFALLAAGAASVRFVNSTTGV